MDVEEYNKIDMNKTAQLKKINPIRLCNFFFYNKHAACVGAIMLAYYLLLN